jgi:acid phosphatase type 7
MNQRHPIMKRSSLVVVLVVGGLGLAGWHRLQAQKPSVSAQPIKLGPVETVAAKTNPPIIAAAGDIACAPNEIPPAGSAFVDKKCRMQDTATLLQSEPFSAVLALGDLQYQKGELENFQASYDRTWGKVKAITRPAPGNHEYYTPGATGYYSYFGAIAGNPNQGYYSFNLGEWHMIALNSNCDAIGGCGAGSPQEKWLKADLTASPAQCTLAYWHHPRFSSGLHSNNASTDALWRALYEAKADVILTGHDHNYERFAPQTPDAKSDSNRGIRQFVVGTGGMSLRELRTVQPHSKARNTQAYGILKLTLKPKSYDWQFIPIPGQTFTDSGSGTCNI